MVEWQRILGRDIYIWIYLIHNHGPQKCFLPHRWAVDSSWLLTCHHDASKGQVPQSLAEIHEWIACFTSPSHGSEALRSTLISNVSKTKLERRGETGVKSQRWEKAKSELQPNVIRLQNRGGIAGALIGDPGDTEVPSGSYSLTSPASTSLIWGQGTKDRFVLSASFLLFRCRYTVTYYTVTF